MEHILKVLDQRAHYLGFIMSTHKAWSGSNGCLFSKLKPRSCGGLQGMS